MVELRPGQRLALRWLPASDGGAIYDRAGRAELRLHYRFAAGANRRGGAAPPLGGMAGYPAFELVSEPLAFSVQRPVELHLGGPADDQMSLARWRAFLQRPAIRLRIDGALREVGLRELRLSWTPLPGSPASARSGALPLALEGRATFAGRGAGEAPWRELRARAAPGRAAPLVLGRYALRLSARVALPGGRQARVHAPLKRVKLTLR